MLFSNNRANHIVKIERETVVITSMKSEVSKRETQTIPTAK